MADAFIIMQIGNVDLEEVYKAAIEPAIRVCGFDAKRVDKHNKGGLLKSEIDSFIQGSEIIVADLTNERPNCYLEIGYAFGLGKLIGVVLTCCEDHRQDSPNHKAGGPKVHFDLEGYDILYWSPNHLSEFRDQLERKIRKRKAMLPGQYAASRAIWDQEWLSKQRKVAIEALHNHQMSGYMEVRSVLLDPEPPRTAKELLEAARRAQIDTFRWPIGIVLQGTPQAPEPVADGIATEAYNEYFHAFEYWSLRTKGDFYLLRNLYEDTRPDDYTFGDGSARKLVFFNTRIHMVTEVLLHAVRLYRQLGAPDDARICVGIVHSGLNGRRLGAIGSSFLVFPSGASREDVAEHEIRSTISDIEKSLVGHVKAFVEPLFMYFGFTEFPDSTYEKIVKAYVDGKVL